MTTKTLRYVGPITPVDLPLLRLTLNAGDTFECDAISAGHAPNPKLDGVKAYGEGLLAQVDNFVEVGSLHDVDEMTAPQLVDYARRNDIDLAGHASKDDKLTAIKAAQSAPKVTKDAPTVIVLDEAVEARDVEADELAAGEGDPGQTEGTQGGTQIDPGDQAPGSNDEQETTP